MWWHHSNSCAHSLAVRTHPVVHPSPPYPHRYFEVNYAGANASFLDQIFGTFCAKFKDGDKEGAKLRDDPKSTLRAVPTSEFLRWEAVCMAGWCACV